MDICYSLIICLLCTTAVPWLQTSLSVFIAQLQFHGYRPHHLFKLHNCSSMVTDLIICLHCIPAVPWLQTSLSVYIAYLQFHGYRPHYLFPLHNCSSMVTDLIICFHCIPAVSWLQTLVSVFIAQLQFHGHWPHYLFPSQNVSSMTRYIILSFHCTTVVLNFKPYSESMHVSFPEKLLAINTYITFTFKITFTATCMFIYMSFIVWLWRGKSWYLSYAYCYVLIYTQKRFCNITVVSAVV